MLLHRKVAIVNIYDDGWIKYVEVKITDKKINNDLLKTMSCIVIIILNQKASYTKPTNSTVDKYTMSWWGLYK